MLWFYFNLLCYCAAIRFRERLYVLLEEEKGQRRKSWQLGVSALEEHQQQLMDAQRSANEALYETDTRMFIHRYNKTQPRLLRKHNNTFE